MKKNITKKSKNKFIIPDFIALLVIGIFILATSVLVWNYSRTNDDSRSYVAPKVGKISEQRNPEECTPHYYDGEVTVGVWEKQISDDEIVVQIDPKDVENLPVNSVDASSSLFVAKLLDPTKKTKKQLKDSSEKNPIQITVKGYAQLCHETPIISLQPATIAFKKDSSGS